MSSLVHSLHADLWHHLAHWLSDDEYIQLLSCNRHIHQELRSKIYPIKSWWMYPGNNTYVKQVNYVVRNSHSELLMGMHPHIWRDIKILDINYDQPIYYWPPRLTELKLSNYNHSLDNLLDSLISLNIRTLFDPHLDHLPQGLKHLKLDQNYYKPLDYLPDHLQSLDVRYQGQNPLDYLPQGLSSLYLRGEYRYPLDNLPEKLSVLKIHVGLHHPVDHLPSQLKTLDITASGLNALDHLPESLEILYIWGELRANSDYLPYRLKTLFLYDIRIQYLDYLPDALEELEIHSYSMNTVNLDYLPQSLLRLSTHICTSSLDHLPVGLHTLRVSRPCKIDHLPKNLHTLKCGFFGHLDHLPPNLHSLHLQNCNSPIDYLPSTLKELFILISDNPKWNHLPPTLKILSIGFHPLLNDSKKPLYNRISSKSVTPTFPFTLTGPLPYLPHLETLLTPEWMPSINHHNFPILKILHIGEMSPCQILITHLPRLAYLGTSDQQVQITSEFPLWPLFLFNYHNQNLQVKINP
jgi:hypothetical protein